MSAMSRAKRASRSGDWGSKEYQEATEALTHEEYVDFLKWELKQLYRDSAARDEEFARERRKHPEWRFIE